jgi:hypothetical protein
MATAQKSNSSRTSQAACRISTDLQDYVPGTSLYKQAGPSTSTVGFHPTGLGADVGTSTYERAKIPRGRVGIDRRQ